MWQLAIDYSSYFIGPYYLWSLNFRVKHKSQSRRILKTLPGYHIFFSLHFPWWGRALFLQILAKPCKSAGGSESFGVYTESLGFSVRISPPPFFFYKTVAFSEHTLPANNALSTYESAISVGVKGALLLPAFKSLPLWVGCAAHTLPSGQHNKVAMIPSAKYASGD